MKIIQMEMPDKEQGIAQRPFQAGPSSEAGEFGLAGKSLLPPLELGFNPGLNRVPKKAKEKKCPKATKYAKKLF